jgi:hypothetical protein
MCYGPGFTKPSYSTHLGSQDPHVFDQVLRVGTVIEILSEHLHACKNMILVTTTGENSWKFTHGVYMETTDQADERKDLKECLWRFLILPVLENHWLRQVLEERPWSESLNGYVLRSRKTLYSYVHTTETSRSMLCKENTIYWGIWNIHALYG